MKKFLLTCLMISSFAHAYTISWNHFVDNGSFTIGNDFKTLGQGTLPPDNSQSVTGCEIKAIANAFTINCSGKIWSFAGSRFACAIGGGGQWTSPDKSTGAYLCGDVTK